MTFVPRLPKHLRVQCSYCTGADYDLVGRGVPLGRVAYSCSECGTVRTLTAELALDWPRGTG